MKCPICSSESISSQVTIPDNEYGLAYKATYINCASCGCYFQHPMPDGSQLASFYPKVYHSMHSKSLIARLKNQSRLKKITPYLSKGDVFMDFGCGNGSFILYAAEQLKENIFYGYEIDSDNSKQILLDGRVVIIKGSLDHLYENLLSCKMISMHHVIEHLPDPQKTINFLQQKLISGGFITGQTPVCDSLERKLFGNKWSGFHAPRHTVVFSRKALNTVFNNSGLLDVKVKTGFNPAAIAVSLASLFNGPNGGIIIRAGFKWLTFVAFSILFAPIDLLTKGSIVDFYARKK